MLQQRRFFDSKLTIILVSLFVCLVTISCEKPVPESSRESLALPSAAGELTKAYTEADVELLSLELWKHHLNTLETLVKQVERLNSSVEVFLEETTADNLSKVREDWVVSYHQYHRLEPFLFLVEDVPELEAYRERLAHWPYYPGFIDRYRGYVQSGVVHDIDLVLNEKSIVEQHQRYDMDEAILGFYPMEYVLWGDYGQRLVNDFVAVSEVPIALSKAGLQARDLPQNRRRQLLRLQSELSLSDVKGLRSIWEEGHPVAIAYYQLSPPERIDAFTVSVSRYLSLLADKMLVDRQLENSALAKVNDFSGAQILAYRYSLAAIDDVYFSKKSPRMNILSTSSESEKLQTNLHDLLSNDEPIVSLEKIDELALGFLKLSGLAP